METQKIYLAQIDVNPGRPDKNLSRMKKFLSETPEDTLSIFPEMAIPGYMIGDDWLRESFIRDCEAMNGEILDILERR